MYYSVNKNKCVKCGICVSICPAGIITNDKENNYPKISDEKKIRCILCAHCMSYCPTNACSVKPLENTSFFEISKNEFPSLGQSETFLRSRRSVRQFTSENIDESLLKKAFSIASTCPSAKNLRPVMWVVIVGREKVKAIADKMNEHLKESISITHKDEQALKIAMTKAYCSGKDIYTRGATALAVSLVDKNCKTQEDGVIATTYLELSAHSLGIGTCWAGYFMYMARENSFITNFSDLLEKKVITGALLLGKPEYNIPKRVPIKEFDKIVWL